DMRETYPADVVWRRSISRHRRALVLWGDRHLERKQLAANYESAGLAETLVSRLESITGMRAFTIWSNTQKEMAPLQAGIASWRVPSLTLLRGTQLGALDFARFSVDLPRMQVRNGSFEPVPRDQW